MTWRYDSAVRIATWLLLLGACGRTPLSPTVDDAGVRDGGGFRDSGPMCTSDGVCGDGLFCNGAELCLDGRCFPGATLACDDGVDCTRDACDESLDSCASVPDNTLCPDGELCDVIAGCAPRPCTRDIDCDDRLICNGRETCSAGGLCVAGPAIECEDGDPCTDTSCDEVIGGCIASPRDQDRDGFGDVRCGGADCDDTDPSVRPGAREQCADRRDNDCDALVDCDDGGCAGSAECAAECEVTDVGSVLGTIARGSTVGRPNAVVPSCSDSGTAGDRAFAWTAPSAGTFIFDTGGSTFDTVLAILTDCPGLELACDDDSLPPNRSRIVRTLARRERVVIVVDGFSEFEGNFVLNVNPLGMEDCADGADNDGDGAVDCADSDCTGDPLCCRPTPERCATMRDEDCDLLIDCADPDCGSDPSCCVPRRELCSGGIDEDCDRLIDCADPICAPDPLCCVASPEVCTNGMDDDCDRLPDCFDRDCFTAPVCCAMRREFCSNTVDDDCDMLIDCADPDCAMLPLCCVPSPESCGNMVDDDCDRLIDCADFDCADAIECCRAVPEDCANMRDDDCDGRTDCLDRDCRGTPACCTAVPEICDNSRDDDCDLRVDCGDSDCFSDPTCCVAVPEVCNDMSDQDCDLLVDCMDPDCAASPVCATCPDRDLGSATGLVASGTTVGAGNEFTPSCRMFSTAPELLFGWRAPANATYQIDTNGSAYDTVLYVKTSCAGPELPGACDDDAGDGNNSLVRVTLRAGDRVVIAVDGFGAQSGLYQLNITMM
jgi:hypothetical protein